MQRAMTQTIPRKKRVKPYEIAGRSFARVQDLEAEINRIRREYRPHNVPVEGEDGRLLTAYMLEHESLPEAEAQHGQLTHIQIEHNLSVIAYREEADQYQITLYFEDGSSEPFSYRLQKNNCFVVDDGFAQARRHVTWLRRAARDTVAGDIEEHRQVHMEYDNTCEISGVVLLDGTAEVHHDHRRGLSFDWMLFTFIKQWYEDRQLDAASIAVEDVDTIGHKRFADPDLCTAWLQYHATTAVLQVLHADVHRQQHVGLVQAPWATLYAEQS